MKILVTGGAGYIGSHTVKTLCDEGYDVLVFDNLSSGFKSNIDKRAKFIKGDVLSEKDLSKALKKGVEAVFHFAASKAVGESMSNPQKYSINNICGSINLINTMIKHAVRLFVFSSSAAVYGSPKYIPIDEKHPINPENYYGFTKRKIEEILEWYSTLKGISFASLRYFNAAGYDVDGKVRGKEQNPQNLIPIIMEVADGTRDSMKINGNDYDTRDGTCIRDYIHVTDLAKAHVLALKYIQNGKNITVNLGSENGISVKEVVDEGERIIGRKLNVIAGPRRPGDPAALIASSKLAHELLGWRAKHSDLKTILQTTWDIYKK